MAHPLQLGLVQRTPGYNHQDINQCNEAPDWQKSELIYMYTAIQSNQ